MADDPRLDHDAEPAEAPGRSEEGPIRLGSWKEIAAFMARSVRTVQRWEQEAGLPVHRYPTRRGEAVFAFREELDNWSRTAAPASSNLDESTLPTNSGGETSQPIPSRVAAVPGCAADVVRIPGSYAPVAARRFRTTAGIGVLLVSFAAVAGVVWRAWSPGRLGPAREPATVKVEHDKVTAFDGAGSPLWTTALPYSSGISEAQFERAARAGGGKHLRLVEDLDADGRSETLVMASNGPQADLFCYDAHGAARWNRRPDSRRAAFGERTMAAPWAPQFITVTPWGRGRKTIWAAWAHWGSFGSFVERLDVTTGRAEAVFWNAGFVTAVGVGHAAGRAVLFVAGDHNESKGATLAVYDLSLAGGAPPAENSNYSCFDCPPGRPLALFVFPKTSLSRAVLAETSPLMVESVAQDAVGQIRVVVLHGPTENPPQAGVSYWFDSQLRLTGADVIDNYRLLHRNLQAQGRLEQPLSERELYPVRSWKEGRFAPIEGPQK